MERIRLIVGVQGARSQDTISARSNDRLLWVLLDLFEPLLHPHGVELQSLFDLAIFHSLQERGLLEGALLARRVIVRAQNLDLGIPTVRESPRLLIHKLNQVSSRAQIDGRVDLHRGIS